MRFCDLIDKKKAGLELTFEELEWAIHGFIEGSIPDYQMSALLMAIYFKGMTDRETADLTIITANSGDILDLSSFGSKSVDKHSTGGVGDKTTLIVAPIVAAAGGIVAKMSGKGLGHTGGTIDKLEAIPGYQATLSEDEFLSISEKTGVSVISASANLAPADKKLYALRDVTSTVNSIPLIVASIMGKKLAAGSRNIVLDVKYGSGAFMKTPEDAEILGQKMVDIGKACGKNICALITDMDIPLGRNIGNFSEVEEAYSLLCGSSEGLEDLKEVCLALSARMIELCLEKDAESAFSIARSILDNGKAAEKFKEWITCQGASLEEFEDKLVNYKNHLYTRDIISDENGYIASMDTEKIGLSALALGAGRTTKDSKIDPSAGISVFKKTGDLIKKGEVIAEICASDPNVLENGEKLYKEALCFSNNPIKRGKVIYKTLT